MVGHRVAGDIRYCEFHMQRAHLCVNVCITGAYGRVVLAHAALLWNLWSGLQFLGTYS